MEYVSRQILFIYLFIYNGWNVKKKWKLQNGLVFETWPKTSLRSLNLSAFKMSFFYQSYVYFISHL